ncbi:hypothetical protein D3C80_1855140 [compost metagenome]
MRFTGPSRSGRGRVRGGIGRGFRSRCGVLTKSLCEFSLLFACKKARLNIEISCDYSVLVTDGMTRRGEVFVCSELELSMDWKLAWMIWSRR